MQLENELKMKGFQSPMQKVILNVLFTSYWLGDKMNSVAKEFDISEQQYNVLRILRGQKGNPINLMDIQSRMLHKTSNVTRLVEKLRLKNFVERVLSEENRRKVEITITKKGLRLLDQMEPRLKESHRDLSRKLSKEEANQLNILLEKLRA